MTSPPAVPGFASDDGAAVDAVRRGVALLEDAAAVAARARPGAAGVCGVWSGAAAESFGAALDDVTRQLAELVEVLGAVGAATVRWEGAVRAQAAADRRAGGWGW